MKWRIKKNEYCNNEHRRKDDRGECGCKEEREWTHDIVSDESSKTQSEIDATRECKKTECGEDKEWTSDECSTPDALLLCAKEIHTKKNEEGGEYVVSDAKKEVDEFIDLPPEIPATPDCCHEKKECKDDKRNSNNRVACFVAKSRPES